MNPAGLAGLMTGLFQEVIAQGAKEQPRVKKKECRRLSGRSCLLSARVLFHNAQQSECLVKASAITFQCFDLARQQNNHDRFLSGYLLNEKVMFILVII